MREGDCFFEEEDRYNYQPVPYADSDAGKAKKYINKNVLKRRRQQQTRKRNPTSKPVSGDIVTGAEESSSQSVVVVNRLTVWVGVKGLGGSQKSN